MYFSEVSWLFRNTYGFFTHLSWLVLHAVALFNPKIKLFVKGRKSTFNTLATIPGGKTPIWIHVASLGEYEQGLPLIEAVREKYPDEYIALTFFSPSGYEIKKDTAPVDWVGYLPMDTVCNARNFVEKLKPKIALFVKYELWPNYLNQLHKKNIPTFLLSGRFHSNQVFFKFYGGAMRKSLNAITHFFLQDSDSQKLLSTIEIDNSTVSGDTRFDRVAQIKNRDNRLKAINEFVNSKLCFVAGSTWPEGEKRISEYINSPKLDGLKCIIAPHTMGENHIQGLQEMLTRKVLLYSEIENHNPYEFDVLIMDNIGMLTKIYSYADIAYVGGGFATGLHNTLEPAVFGIPILTGPKYSGFPEAENLVALGGIIPITNAHSFSEVMEKLRENQEYRLKVGSINDDYISQNQGATQEILGFLKPFISFG